MRNESLYQNRRRRAKPALPLTIAAFAVIGQAAWAAPQPSKAPKSWQLDFEFHDLQRLEMAVPGDPKPTTFWYLLYTVTNNAGQDVEFYPAYELVTDTLDVVAGGDHIYPGVYDAIQARHKRVYPFMRAYTEVSGKLLQGPDNALTAVAVFRDFDPHANAFKVYVSGLSGEVVRMPNPVFDADQPESTENPRFFTLRKTIEIGYDFPGDTRTRASTVPIRREQAWLMR